MLYKNDSDEARIWPGIQRPDVTNEDGQPNQLNGTTLELEAGEEIDLPNEIRDPYLRPVGWELRELADVYSVVEPQTDNTKETQR